MRDATVPIRWPPPARGRWQAPPGWPAPPPGWVPPPGWQPDPSWPPVPPGWRFWSRAPRSLGQRLAVTFGALVAVAFVALSAVGLYAYVTADNIEFFDGTVEARASVDCTTLDRQLDALPPLGSAATAQQKAARVDEQVALARGLVTDMQSLGPKVLANDQPSPGWIKDWSSLADARASYAEQLRDGAPTPVMSEPQTSDGYPISRRMKDASPSECASPIDTMLSAPR